MRAAIDTPRWGYRVREITERTGLKRSTVDRHARATGIERRKIGSAVLLEATGVEREFGFDAKPTGPQLVVTPEALALARRLVA